MSQPYPPKLNPEVQAVITATGLPWEWRPGGKHWKGFLGGRLAVVQSYGRGNEMSAARRQDLNTIRAIKRIARALEETS